MAHLLRRNPRTAWHRVENEVLIISSDTNTLTVLNDPGARIWELLETQMGVDELAMHLVDEFEVDAVTARRDVERFVDDLRKGNLVLTDSLPPRVSSPVGKGAT